MTTGDYVLLVYLIGCVVFLIPTCRFIARTMDGDGMIESAGDVVFAIIIGVTMVWFWPLFVPGYWVYKAVAPDHLKEKE